MKKVNNPEAKGTNEGAQREEAPMDLSPDSHEQRGVATAGAAPREAAADPFDPAHLALGQNFAEAMAVKKLSTHVPIRKPNKHEWFRVHPDPAYRLQTTLLALKGEREELYLVPPHLRAELVGELCIVELFTCINRDNVVFLVAVKLPGPDGRLNTWVASLMDAMSYARDRWVRVMARMALGAYETFAPEGHLPDPDWPATPFADLLRIAFRDRTIDSLDHAVIRNIRGKE
jgi:hypothetical protein